jgi:hypothetical protein
MRRLIPVLALLLSAPVFAAGSVCAPPPPHVEKHSDAQELEEVVVVAKENESYLRELRTWLKRLVGEYEYEGYVDICGNGNREDQRPVTGRADCIAISPVPTVQCTVNMRWPVAVQANGQAAPGSAYNLVTAHVIYSVEDRFIPEQQMNRWGLMSMQVDTRGNAEWASGALIGDSFVSKEPCVGMPGDCRKSMRITAERNSDEVTMLVDTEVGKQRVMRQSLVLHRDSRSPKAESSGSHAR